MAGPAPRRQLALMAAIIICASSGPDPALGFAPAPSLRPRDALSMLHKSTSRAPTGCLGARMSSVSEAARRQGDGGKAGGEISSEYLTMQDIVGKTPMVRVVRMDEAGGRKGNVVLAKLEGNNPAGSVKDRPAMNMITAAEERGQIKPGDTLIEATSGNTGIALAMAAAIRGYKMVLIMPAHMSEERRATMRVYGAEIISVSKEGGMEEARDLALQMEKDGKGLVLNQFGNLDNPDAHYKTTGPEIWEGTRGKITHFVSSMGTTGTIMGVSRYLKEKNPDIQIVGVTPAEGASIPGIRRWPKEYLPTIFEDFRVDQTIEVTQQDAEETARRMAREEGIFCGVSSGGTLSAALRLSETVSDATIVTIVCDRGDRYLSTGVF